MWPLPPMQSSLVRLSHPRPLCKYFMVTNFTSQKPVEICCQWSHAFAGSRDAKLNFISSVIVGGHLISERWLRQIFKFHSRWVSCHLDFQEKSVHLFSVWNIIQGSYMRMKHQRQELYQSWFTYNLANWWDLIWTFSSGFCLLMYLCVRRYQFAFLYSRNFFDQYIRMLGNS